MILAELIIHPSREPAELPINAKLYLAQIFRSSPMMGLAILMCLGTILWCLLLAHRHRSGLDRFLSGALGLLAVYQALRILKDTGVVVLTGVTGLDASVDFISSGMCLVATLILKLSYADRASTKIRLRLVEANEKTLDLSGAAASLPMDIANAAVEASPLAMFAVDISGSVNYWNASAEKLFGWKRDEILGHCLPFEWDGQGKSNIAATFRNKSGQWIEGAAWTAPLHHASGSVRGTLTVVAEGASSLTRAALQSAETSREPRPSGSVSFG